jgi:hypothetical protein
MHEHHSLPVTQPTQVRRGSFRSRNRCAACVLAVSLKALDWFTRRSSRETQLCPHTKFCRKPYTCAHSFHIRPSCCGPLVWQSNCFWIDTAGNERFCIPESFPMRRELRKTKPPTRLRSTCVLELLARSVKKPHPYVNLARASSLCGELGHHIAEDCDWLPGMHTGLSLSVSREFHSLGPRRGHAP